jgi:hypothetical protein
VGADIHITVGRINKPMLTGPEEQAAGTALALFNNKHFQFGDFEFDSDIPNEVDLYRNYSLFSFLSAVRGKLRPIIPLSDLRGATDKFIQWINAEHRKLEAPKDGSWPMYAEDLIGDCARYDVGEHSQVFYPIPVLVGFNYDQPVELESEDSDCRSSYRTYYRSNDPDDTYRAHVGDQFFKFLEWCVRENWQFVIFGFDS